MIETVPSTTNNIASGTEKTGKLTIKFVIPVSILIVLISALLTLVVTRVAKNSLEVALQDRAKSLVENLAYNSELGVLTGQQQMLQDTIAGVIRQEDILYV